jgi:monoamine oxidase
VVESRGATDEISADYLVCTLPAITLADVRFDPPMPERQRESISRLRYGRATKTLLQFERAFWRRRKRPRAFGTPEAFGAVWDGNEEQHGTAGILTLLAGGGASPATQEILSHGGVAQLLQRLAWFGASSSALLAHSVAIWDTDPWSRGGYAYFDPGYDPALRSWLARPCGRVFFAGEHTSFRWQGYMNGAVETGLRAAAEIVRAQNTE